MRVKPAKNIGLLYVICAQASMNLFEKLPMWGGRVGIVVVKTILLRVIK